MSGFTTKFIAFVDIIGFKKFVADAEKDTGFDLERILSLFPTSARVKSANVSRRAVPSAVRVRRTSNGTWIFASHRFRIV